ncbi:MAG: FmdB family zinc ribbon protein [Candidatus Limnocylindrales bacterium]
MNAPSTASNAACAYSARSETSGDQVPFYDYVCENCGHEMEVAHSLHESGPVVCPNCHGRMRKSISAPAVHFKGTGWARTEPKGKAPRTDSKEPKSSPTDAAPPAPAASSDASPSKDPD